MVLTFIYLIPFERHRFRLVWTNHKVDRVCFKMFCLLARSGYHGIQSGNLSTSPSGQNCNFHTNLKKVFNFLVAKSGYQEPKSGSLSKFQVAWGYRATHRHCMISWVCCVHVSVVSRKPQLLRLTLTHSHTMSMRLPLNLTLSWWAELSEADALHMCERIVTGDNIIMIEGASGICEVYSNTWCNIITIYMYIGITFNKRILSKIAISNVNEMLFEIAFWNKISGGSRISRRGRGTRRGGRGPRRLRFKNCIGGFRGVRTRCTPVRDPILSFWHTNFTKHSRLGSPRPPLRGPRPPYGKSWIRHWTVCQKERVWTFAGRAPGTPTSRSANEDSLGSLTAYQPA